MPKKPECEIGATSNLSEIRPDF